MWARHRSRPRFPTARTSRCASAIGAKPTRSPPHRPSRLMAARCREGSIMVNPREWNQTARFVSVRVGTPAVPSLPVRTREPVSHWTRTLCVASDGGGPGIAPDTTAWPVGLGSSNVNSSRGNGHNQRSTRSSFTSSPMAAVPDEDRGLNIRPKKRNTPHSYTSGRSRLL